MIFEDFKYLVNQAISLANKESETSMAFKQLLTLGGKQKFDDGKMTLGYRENQILQTLELTDLKEDPINLDVYFHNNKIEVTTDDLRHVKNSTYAFSFDYPLKKWKHILAEENELLNIKYKQALLHIGDFNDLKKRHVVDMAEFFLAHMAPIIFYINENVYSNFDYLSNLYAKRRKDKDDFLFEKLRNTAIKDWKQEDLIFICFLNYLLSSGIQTRAEEFNGKQVSMSALVTYLERKNATYVDMGISDIEDFKSLTLDEKVRALRQKYAKIQERKIVYRRINGLSLQKSEEYLNDATLLEDLPQNLKLSNSLKLNFKIDSANLQSYKNSVNRYLTNDDGDLEEKFLKLLRFLLFDLSEKTSADMAFSRFFSSLGRLLELDKNGEYQAISDLNAKNYYCYVVPGRKMVEKLPKVLVTNVNMAVTSRMLYNSWHYMPANFLNDGINTEHREFYFSAVMADIANLDKYHHVGHVKMSINNTIRVPKELYIHGRTYKALLDVRLMRRGDQEFSVEDLGMAVNYTSYIQHLCQVLLDVLDKDRRFDFALEQMDKHKYSLQFSEIKEDYLS